MSDFTVLDIETTGNTPWSGELLAVGLGNRVLPPDAGRAAVRHALAGGRGVVVAHTNYDLRWLLLDGATLGDGIQFHDTKVMAWMDDATQELGLDDLAKRYLGTTPLKPIRKKLGRIMFDLGLWHGEEEERLVPIEEVPWEVMEAYNRSDLETEAALYTTLRDALRRKGLWHQFLAEEAPFSSLLVEMEATGIPFDKERAKVKLDETLARLESLRQALVWDTGAIDFNPGSGDQVARFLYTELWSQPVKFAIPRLVGMSAEEKRRRVVAIAPKGVIVDRVGREYAYGKQWLDGLGLPVPKEKNPGLRPTVSGKVLNVLYGDMPWVARYCEWLKADKLRGYLVAWIEQEHDGKLHGRFDQSGTATGRLAGREPNLQQVSKESDIRDLFRGDFVMGDYAGLEARIAAHFSGDEVMLDIFRSGKDLYGVLAARAWGGPADKTNENRALMKIVWLASQYGARGDTLAQTMAEGGIRGYSGAEADGFLREMQAAVPRLFEWRDEVIAKAKVDGYVKTIGGRVRQLADINSASWRLAYTAERQAVNTYVQGSAADIVRRAMLKVRKVVPVEVARLSLQVHDELLLIRGPEFDPDWLDIVQDICEQGTGYALDVPLSFVPVESQSWAEKE